MNPLRSLISAGNRQLVTRMGSRPMAVKSSFVTFCFDDFPRSALHAGGAILRSYGACGTYYAALSLMGTRNGLGEQFVQDDLDALLHQEHELGCHTFQHLSCRSTTPSSFERDVTKGRKRLFELTGCDPANFAYPYGHVTPLVKKKVGAQMGSCRSIFGGVNGTIADLNLLRANSLYGDVDQLPDVLKLLAATKESGGWLIFYTHDVRPNPSPYGCTPALFEETVAKVLEYQLPIETVAGVINKAFA